MLLGQLECCRTSLELHSCAIHLSWLVEPSAFSESYIGLNDLIMRYMILTLTLMNTPDTIQIAIITEVTLIVMRIIASEFVLCLDGWFPDSVGPF